MAGVSKVLFGVKGMECPGCATRIAEALNAVPGVERAEVDFMTRQAKVTWKGESVSALHETVRRLGYEVIGDREASKGRPVWLVSVVSGAMWGVAFVLHHVGSSETAARLLYLATIAVSGWRLAGHLVASLRARRVDEYVLMGVSVGGAMGLGEWGEASALVVLLSAADFLESFSVERARRAVQALMSLMPEEATVRRNGSEERVPVASVSVGETVIVRPGECIPLDGTVVRGVSAVNEASLTGESRLVEKRPGENVYAGTVNDLGSLEFVVAKTAEDTTLARIVRLVEEAQRARSRSERFVDRFARHYTPAVVVAAILVTALPVAWGGAFSEWFYRSLVVLMIGCPCALVLSTPVTILAGLARGAREGILIKGGIHLENLGLVRSVALDKTGTLTKGMPFVLDVIPLKEDFAQDDVLRIAAGVESRSEHLHAQAILREANRLGVQFVSQPERFVAVPGKGAWATLEGVEYGVGSARLFAEVGVEGEPYREKTRVLEEAGRSVVFVGTKTNVLGVIGLGDEVREESADVVAALKRLRVARTVLLTGDHVGVAEKVGSKVGVDAVFAGLLPEEKAQTVAELTKTYGSVLMVGDGINDAPALAVATVGMAIGGRGNDIALETADAVLMEDSLRRLPMALVLGRKSRQLIFQNVLVSVGSKGAVFVLATLGVATLWMAVLADVGVSLLVVLNGLRMLRFQENGKR